MKQLHANTKHHILLEYRPRCPTHSLTALARRHGVKGGKQTLYRWHRQWDGTVQSLERKEVAGRPRVLSRAQVSRHIKPRILSANRHSSAIRYTDVLPLVQRSTGTNVSIQSL